MRPARASPERSFHRPTFIRPEIGRWTRSVDVFEFLQIESLSLEYKVYFYHSVLPINVFEINSGM